MEEGPPESDFELLNWYKEAYNHLFKLYKENLILNSLLDGYGKNLASLLSKGIEMCDDEISNYLTSSGTISFDFLNKTNKNLEKLEGVMSKISLYGDIMMKSIDFNNKYLNKSKKFKYIKHFIFLN